MVVIAFGLSAILNLALLGIIWKIRHEKKERKPSLELTEFLADLARGGGMVSVRVDPEHLLLRSPRG